jgi:hypothetical protein
LGKPLVNPSGQSRFDEFKLAREKVEEFKTSAILGTWKPQDVPVVVADEIPEVKVPEDLVTPIQNPENSIPPTQEPEVFVVAMDPGVLIIPDILVTESDVVMVEIEEETSKPESRDPRMKKEDKK